MEDAKNSHIVEIPVEQEVSMTTAIQQHPMMEISRSPGHLLLLKLWQREEELLASRITLKERRLDSIRAEIFQLCSFFVLYHALFSIILFMSASASDVKCNKWWVPSFLSMATSVGMAGLVQIKMRKYWKVGGGLQRQQSENRALTRYIQELRMKGASFDLSKRDQCQPQKMRIKSSSVEIKWMSMSSCSQYLVTLCLLLFTALVFPAPRLFLCILS